MNAHICVCVAQVCWHPDHGILAKRGVIRQGSILSRQFDNRYLAIRISGLYGFNASSVIEALPPDVGVIGLYASAPTGRREEARPTTKTKDRLRPQRPQTWELRSLKILAA